MEFHGDFLQNMLLLPKEHIALRQLILLLSSQYSCMDSLMDLFQAMFEERYVLTQSSDTPLIYIVLTAHPQVDCGYLLAAEAC